MRQTSLIASLACLILLLLCQTNLSSASEIQVGCNKSVADIVFVLDESGSVGSKNYKLMKKFLINLVKDFDIGPENVRIALITFSTKVYIHFYLNKYSTSDSIAKAIKELPYKHGATNTAIALKLLRTSIFVKKNGNRENVPNIAIVITDGKSTRGKDTLKEAEALKKTNIKVFSIGVGDTISFNELESMASDPVSEHVFKVNNFAALPTIKKNLSTKTCKIATSHIPSNVCSQADILFILDSSGSISNKNFGLVLKFLTKIVGGFDIGKDSIRVGVTIFADKIVEKLHLNQFYDKTTLIRAISNIQRISGGTNTGDALLRARTISLVPEHGKRSNVPNIVIVITDGKSKSAKKTALHADELRKTGAVIFSIGIGPSIDLNELKAIATGPDTSHVFQVKTFKNLKAIVKEFFTKTCSAIKDTVPPKTFTTSPPPTTKKNTTPVKTFTTLPPPTTKIYTTPVKTFTTLPPPTTKIYTTPVKTFTTLPPPTTRKYTTPTTTFTTLPLPTTTCNKSIADIIFALDTSASVSMSEFKTMLDFVKHVILNTFDIGQDNVRVGVVTFSDKAVLQFHLNKYSNMNQLLDAISHVKYLAGSTNTADVLRYIRTTSFLKQNGNRDNVPNIVIVITDGKSNVPVSTAAEAARLKRISTVFSIGIGNHAELRELKSIATDEKHIFTVKDFDTLKEIKHSLAIKTCEAGREPKDPTKCSEKADIVFMLDSSGLSGNRNFQKLLDFVKKITKHFYVKPDEVQIGIDTFDIESRTEFNMSKYENLESLLGAISKIPVRHYDQTHMGKALKRLREQSMTSFAGARHNVTHIGILLTDSKHTGPLNVVDEAEKVKEAGIKLFAFGIGPAVNYEQLERIADRPSNKFLLKAEKFDSIKSIEPLLSQEICKVAAKKEEDIVCTLSEAADVVFVVDSSGSVGRRNFTLMLDFVNSLVNKFRIGPQAMQIGMLRYNSRNYLEFNLNKHTTKAKLQEAINNVHYTLGLTFTSEAISFMHYNMFARASGYRLGVPKIAIVLTDGRSKNFSKTYHEAKEAQKDNIIMFAIGIGSRVNMTELKSIASQPSESHMFSIKDFTALKSIVNSLANKTCKVIPKGSKPFTCQDKIPRCHEFERRVCREYPRWSHEFCPNYCGMCFTSTTCTDVARTCHMLGQKNCAEFPAWSRENCAKSCAFCGNEGKHTEIGDKANNTDIGDKVYACSYKGKKYQTGESWQDGCAYECTCLDAERGMVHCWNRCPVYYNLPSQCKLINIGEKCCKEPICNFQGKFTRTIGHKRGERFGVDVCIHNHHEYYQGQTWSVGCEADCVCQNAKSGYWSCTSRCPQFYNLPSNCSLIKKAGQCCREVKCEFTTDFGRFKGHSKVVNKVNPVITSCVDKRPCEELSPSICHAKDLESWVIEHCPRYCNKCPTPSVPSEGACLVNGKVYKVGETWNKSCSLTCMCEDGHHGIARCFDKCAKFSSLPLNCKKLRIPGECCERIFCSNGKLIGSQKLNNTIGGHTSSNKSISNTQRGCMYKGSYHEPNEMWTDGCEWVCQCFNGNEGLYKCSRRCPTFKNLPDSCHMENVPGDPCCQRPSCNKNPSHILVPDNGKEIIANEKVTDPVKDGCVYDNVTYQEGEDWIDGCKYFCKCTDGKRGMYVCNDRCKRISYIPDNCHVVNDPNDDCCEKLVCDAVTSRPEIQTTPAIIGKCYYKGEMYNQGDRWYDECSLECFCENAQIGYYRCTDRCYGFSSIPADCSSKPDPNDPKCCKIFDCENKDLPRGFIGIKNGFGKSVQPDNTYKDKCVYKENIYQQGEVWTDGCEDCECIDAKQGHYKCHTRCEKYFSLPINCHLVEPIENNCCPSLNCSKQQEECKDNSEMCDEIGPDVCTGEWKELGMKSCHKTCGQCISAETEAVEAEAVGTEAEAAQKEVAAGVMAKKP